MKTIIIVLTILILSFNAFADEWHSEQALHFGGEFAITACTYKILTSGFHVAKWKAIVASSVLAFSVGLGKEVFDMRNGGEFGTKDMLVNSAGILSGIGFVYFIEF
jgi:hypothetical protein